MTCGTILVSYVIVTNPQPAEIVWTDNDSFGKALKENLAGSSSSCLKKQQQSNCFIFFFFLLLFCWWFLLYFCILFTNNLMDNPIRSSLQSQAQHCNFLLLKITEDLDLACWRHSYRKGKHLTQGFMSQFFHFNCQKTVSK